MRNLKRILALTLAFVLVLALGVTAFAYDDNNSNAFVSITCDGREVYTTSRMESGSADIKTLGPATLTSLRVNDASIPLSALEDSLQTAQTRYVNGYSAVDGVYRIYTENYNNTRVARIYWSGLRTGLYVTAESGYTDSYKVYADAKPAGAVKITGDGNVNVAAGASWSATFTPTSNTQTIKSMYVVVDGTSREFDCPSYGSMDYTVKNQDMRLTRNSDNSVTVSMARVYGNVSLTAQAYNLQNDRFKLNVITGRYITSNISSDWLDAYTTRDVVFTPDRGYTVGTIRITDGDQVGTLTFNQNSIRLNGKTYAIERKTDGRVVLSIPRMTADVTVEASVTADGYVVTVLGEKYVSSSKPGENLVAYGDGFTVTFYTRDVTYYTGIEVKTAKGTFTASYDDDYITISGVRYEMYRNIRGDVTLSFDRVPCDMTISPTSREARPGYHKIAATTDKYVKSNAFDTWVYNGDDTSVTFALTDAGAAANDAIRQIRVTYNGKTTYADPANEDSIKVGNKSWDITVDSDGNVTVYMTNVSADVDIYASVDEKGSENGSGHNTSKNWKITKTTDSHSNITYTGKAPFDNGDETTVRVYTDNKYIIKSVTFTMSGKTVTVKPFDAQFVLNGETYAITWTTNGDMNVKFDTLTSNLTVKAVSEKGDIKKPDGGSVTPVQQPDLTQIPSEPQIPDNTPITPSYDAQTYHPAFMIGFGDGTFRPDQLMTRAQALTVLGRVYAGLNDESAKAYATAAGFADVNPSDWFAGYVGYAKQQGYLNNWLSLGATNFSANVAITRAEFVVLLCNYTNQNLVGTSTTQVFMDVPSSHWAYTFINYCAARGWALGYDANSFRPDEALTRAQICALVNRVTGRLSNSHSGYMANQFTDVASTAWYFNDVMEATNHHNVSGMQADGTEIWVA